MLIPRKEKGQLEIYKCKLGIHDWVTEHWWETRQKPRKAIFSKKGGRKKAQYYNKHCTRTYCRICGKNPRSLMTISCIQADYLLGVPRSVIKLKYNVSDFSITMYTKRFRT